MCILHRDLGAHFVRGLTPDRYLANYMGRSGGVTGGKDGNMHFGDPSWAAWAWSRCSPTWRWSPSGMALAFKTRGEKRVAMTYFGEGSTANGQWHEAMNMAGVQRSSPSSSFSRTTVRLLDPQLARVRGRPGRARADLWIPGRDG